MSRGFFITLKVLSMFISFMGMIQKYLVIGYSDFDYDADVDNRRSMTSYVFTLSDSIVSSKTIL